MLLPVEPRPESSARTAAGSDLRALHQALDKLRSQGQLADADYHRLLDALNY